MRIGIYKDTLSNRRGADMVVLALAEGLRERGHDALVFEKPDFAKRTAEPWDVLISTGTNELLDLYDCCAGRSTSRSCPDTPANPVGKAFPWPVIQQFHTNPKSQFKWKRLVRNWRIGRALRRVSAIQVLGESFVPLVMKFRVPVEVIGNWSRYQSLASQSSVPQLSTIIYPAAFAKGKNQKLLIEAFSRVAAEFPEWGLRLLGRADGAYAEECRRLAVRTAAGNRIAFRGFSEDLAHEYAQCAFVAFPSLDEGFGLVIADAAAFAKPCVMVRDWIGTVKAHGGVKTEQAVAAYADGLRRLMADGTLRRNMGEAAREFCAASYSREKILAEWESLIRNVAR